MSSNIDQDFVEYIVKSLVGNPDKVVIERRIDEKGVLLELTVDPEDLGRIIGKRGATAQSLRTLPQDCRQRARRLRATSAQPTTSSGNQQLFKRHFGRHRWRDNHRCG